MLTRTTFAVGLLALGAVLVPGLDQLTAASPGRQDRPRPVGERPFMPVQPVGPRSGPGILPGSDWWRIYPWSPYNYGRNPYNPAYYPPDYPPYPYYSPYASPYYPQGYGYGSGSGLADGSMVPRSQGPEVMLPHPTGELKAAPPDAAVIEVRLPDPFGQVFFDGVKTSSVGTDRYYVTPELKGGPYSYTVRATWNAGGQPTGAERTVQVAPGHFSVVDFTQNQGASRP